MQTEAEKTHERLINGEEPQPRRSPNMQIMTHDELLAEAHKRYSEQNEDMPMEGVKEDY